jgi:glycosidase
MRAMGDSSTTEVVSRERRWWKEAVFYQIYPRSFNDSDGDGVGDIPGMVEKVDYLDDLGVDAVWLNPVYESPQADFGYDIADYRAINPEYGTMDDWDRLLAELHARDIRLVMDLVVNHTSKEHEWFQRSRAAEEPYEDYYIWRPSDDGHPNNWESHFDIPAWTYDDERAAYYLHLFTRDQPDLNWKLRAVREEIFNVISWWLERGIDGFRLDVINEISKEPGLPDGDPECGPVGAEHHINGPRMHEYFEKLSEQGFGEHRERVATIGECALIDPETALDVTGRESALLDMVIYFDHMQLDGRDRFDYREWELTDLKEAMTRWQDAVAEGTWVALYHSNHDQPRAVSRFGDPDYRYESATMLATWLHGHRGTPFVYQGEEIGMSNVSFESPRDLVDPWAINHWENEREAGRAFDEVREDFERLSRDNARTPMQWSDAAHAGFSADEPWMPVGDDFETVNVAADRDRKRSVFEYYRDLIALRDGMDVLVYGAFDLLLPDHERIYAFRRTLPEADQELLIVCNFSDDRLTFEAPASVDVADATMVLANLPEPETEPVTVELRPYEAIIYEL